MKESLLSLCALFLLSSCHHKNKVNDVGGTKTLITDVRSGGIVDQYLLPPYTTGAHWVEFRKVYDSSSVPGPSDPKLYIIVPLSRNLPSSTKEEVEMDNEALHKLEDVYPKLKDLLEQGQQVDISSLVVPGTIPYYGIQKSEKVFLIVGKM